MCLSNCNLHRYVGVCIGSIMAAIGEVDFDNWGMTLMCISELAEVRGCEWGGGGISHCRVVGLLEFFWGRHATSYPSSFFFRNTLGPFRSSHARTLVRWNRTE
jgi:hypothetical protein